MDVWARGKKKKSAGWEFKSNALVNKSLKRISIRMLPREAQADTHIKMKEQMVNVYIIACKREPRFSLSSNSKNISTRGKMWFHHVNYITTSQRRNTDRFLNECKCEHASRQSLKRNRVTCSPRSQGLSPRAMVSTLCTRLRWEDKRLACKTHTHTWL